VLFGVAPLDPATYAAVIGLVLAVVAAAAYAPARRAALADPQALLRLD
jgi:putative ABC transport system permease protein